MTNEQINAAIAEATDCAGHGNYTHDLNSMHKAEKTLDYDYAELFGDTLADICYRENRQLENPFPWTFSQVHATARQRAEAFLRTLGKWKEEELEEEE